MPVMFGNQYDIAGASPSNGAVFGGTYPPINMANFTRDATSNKAVPGNTTEWNNFLASFGSTIVAPGHLWGMQDASGNITNSIGAQVYTAAASMVYQKSVTGWARKAISGTSGVDVIPSNSGTVNTATTSWMLLTYMRYDSGAALRTPATFGSSSLIVPTNTIRLRLGGNTVTSTGDHSTTVHPFLWAYNFTNSTCKLYTDLEKLTVTFTLSSGHVSTVAPSATADPGVCDFLYQVGWDGAAAETTDAEAKKLITALGYSPPWS